LLKSLKRSKFIGGERQNYQWKRVRKNAIEFPAISILSILEKLKVLLY
jgi:hypothetical protein